jgi:hypothetical protein
MSWSGVLTTLDAILVTAGKIATLADANKVTLVRQGEPGGVNVPTLAYWWTGDRESQTGGNSLNKTNVEEGLQIMAYWPVQDRSEGLMDRLENDIRTMKQAITAGLWGDATLGGNCIGITIDSVTGGWQDINGRYARVLDMRVWIDLAFVDDIAP